MTSAYNSYTPNVVVELVALLLAVLSQSQGYFTIGGLPPIISSWRQAP
jgi:hypothetical protein